MVGFPLRDSGETMGSYLPNSVMEEIFSRVPFPDALKVRAISQHWRRKFRALICAKWAQYWPVTCYFKATSNQTTLVALNTVTKCLEMVPLNPNVARIVSSTHLAGPFALQRLALRRDCSTSARGGSYHDDKICVVHIFTGECIELPTLGHKFVINGGRKGDSHETFESLIRCNFWRIKLKLLSDLHDFKVQLAFDLTRIGDKAQRTILLEFRAAMDDWKEVTPPTDLQTGQDASSSWLLRLWSSGIWMFYKEFEDESERTRLLTLRLAERWSDFLGLTVVDEMVVIVRGFSFHREGLVFKVEENSLEFTLLSSLNF